MMIPDAAGYFLLGCLAMLYVLLIANIVRLIIKDLHPKTYAKIRDALLPYIEFEAQRPKKTSN